MFKIRLSDVSVVKDFVAITAGLACELDVQHGRYIVDGKSIMGLFSLDLTNELTVVVHAENQAVIDECKSKLSKFIVA